MTRVLVAFVGVLVALIAAARNAGAQMGDGGQLAMDFFMGSTSDVVLLDLRTGALLPLAHDSTAHEFAPNWSPDGHRLLFQSATAGDFSHARPITLMDMRTRAAHPLSGYFGAAPVWSPDGAQVAFDIRVGYAVIDVRDGSESVLQPEHVPAWVTSDLRERLVIALAATPEMAERFATLDEARRHWLVYASLRQVVPAPDGQQAAVILHDERGSRRLAVIDLSCLPDCVGALVERARMPMIASPTWSPDSRHIAFACTPRADAAAITGICVMPSSGGAPRFLMRTTRLRHTEGSNISWRPSG
jgi:Tol biopolymer transport system component